MRGFLKILYISYYLLFFIDGLIQRSICFTACLLGRVSKVSPFSTDPFNGIAVSRFLRLYLRVLRPKLKAELLSSIHSNDPPNVADSS